MPVRIWMSPPCKQGSIGVNYRVWVLGNIGLSPAYLARSESFFLNILVNNSRLITAYILLRVNLDKIMHARWDFDASSARTRRVGALDKHQNWSVSALLCLNSRAQSKYAVVNLIHTQRKESFFCLLLCDKQDILLSLKVIQIWPTKYNYPFRK